MALLELPRGLTPAQLAGGFGLPDALALSGRIEESFLRRLEALPAETQRLLLVAAAEPVGDPVLLWRAAERLGIGRHAAEPAEADGLLEIGARVTVSSSAGALGGVSGGVAGRAAAVHRALAEATDPEVDPDRRAWHLAEAAAGPDEDVAVRARALGGPRAGARRTGGRGRVPGASRRADA